MDTASYLKRHGWQGDGHALSAAGIAKPLLISKKVDVLGVGLNKHAAVSDQWWMRAFDQGLKHLGTGKQTVLGSVREKGIVHGGLYGRFVKGESIAGTFGEEEKVESEQKASKKRKRDMEGIRGLKKQRKLDKATKGKVDKDKHAESSVSRQKRDLDRQAETFVQEAMSRGLMPIEGSGKPLKGSPKSAAEVYGEEVVLEVFKQAGVDIKSARKPSGKRAKYEVSKMRRVIERTARAYLLAQLPLEERTRIEADDERKAEQGKKRKRAEQKERDEVAAAKAAEKEARDLRKKQKREEKKKLKAEHRMNEDSGDNAGDEFEAGVDEVKLDKIKKSSRKVKNLRSDTSGDAVGFIVDTTGDDALDVTGASQFPVDGTITLLDNDGKVRRVFQPGETIPLDKTIWEGINPKSLPRPVRHARSEYMAQKREAKKAREERKVAKREANSRLKAKHEARQEVKKKGARKLEAQEKIVMRILFKSRKAQRDDGDTAPEDDNLPVVRITTKNGSFTTEEMSLARRKARRVLKEEKREREGKEKGVNKSKAKARARGQVQAARAAKASAAKESS